MSSKNLSFVTGATGFVGAAVARELSENGHKLRLLARKDGDRRNLRGLENAEIIEGDLLRPESYSHALKGCDALFHVAADYRIWVKNPDEMNKVNVDGSRALMDAALSYGVGKVVYTSSVATLGINSDGTPSDENTPSSIEDMVGVYKKSKFLAEKAVKEMIDGRKLPCVVVNPSTPIGPRDVKPTPTGRIITEAAKGNMPAYVDTGLNIAHVADVARGHRLAFEKGKIGERYILGGTNLAFSEILGIVARLVGRTPPSLALPRTALFPLAFVAETIARITGKEPFVTMDGLRMAKKKMFFSSAKAENELGYSYLPPDSAISDAIKWFKDNGYI